MLLNTGVPEMDHAAGRAKASFVSDWIFGIVYGLLFWIMMPAGWYYFNQNNYIYSICAFLIFINLYLILSELHSNNDLFNIIEYNWKRSIFWYLLFIQIGFIVGSKFEPPSIFRVLPIAIAFIIVTAAFYVASRNPEIKSRYHTRDVRYRYDTRGGAVIAAMCNLGLLFWYFS